MDPDQLASEEASWSKSTLFSLVYVWFHTAFKGVYRCILFKNSKGFPQIIMHYLFFNMGQVKLSMDKYLMAIYLSLGKYKRLLFPHPCYFVYYFLNSFDKNTLQENH